MGSLFVLKNRYFKTLNKLGIKTIPFNPLTPIVAMVVNNRDHRKLLIIDGKVAFTGGINIADEYINQKEVHGKWKDTVVMIKGEAVRNNVLMFLTLWNACVKKKEKDIDFNKYLAETHEKSDGFVCPFSHNPFLREKIAQDVYINMINNAKEYVYIFTPYLIIDDILFNSLITAVKKGVEVKIVIPGVPDKKIVYNVSLDNARRLMEYGVKVYAYTPGFIHAKSVLVDGRVGVVGTINFDYRSLYHHFEDGIFFFESSVLKDLTNDCEQTILESKPIVINKKRYSLIKRTFYALLNLFSPLM